MPRALLTGGPIGLLLILPLAIAATRPSDAVKTLSPKQYSDPRPNILLIMTDDQSHDTLTEQFMPFTKRMIADQGITFTNGYMSTALCCPSRASFLTGQYARKHGVHTNEDPLNATTVADRLHAAGYYTGMIGKYLNSWPGDARPEFNYWACWKNRYIDPKINVFGEFKEVPGYLTYILRDFALDFLDKTPDDKPFFLLWTPHAPHAPATPAPGDEQLYSDLPAWRPPNFNPADQLDKPQWLATLPLLTPDDVATIDTFRLDQLRCLHSVDLAVRDILTKVAEQGRLDNTLVVFYSDNGYFWGEHRLVNKNRVYEEASHGPFALRYPPMVSTPRTEDRLIQVIDLAPTIYQLAGVPMPADVDGRSLVPLMLGTDFWRDALLLEGWPANQSNSIEASRARVRPSARTQDQGDHYQAIRTEHYVYVETEGDSRELYDVRADPYQLNNLAIDPRYKKVVRKLARRLSRGEFS